MAATRSMPDSYFRLVRRFPLVRIATDDVLAEALTVVDELVAQQPDAGTDAYLGALSALVHLSESEHHPIPAATAAEVLRELAEVNGLTGAEVARRSGLTPGVVSALMSGKRRPNPDQCNALADVFRVGPGVFSPEGNG